MKKTTAICLSVGVLAASLCLLAVLWPRNDEIPKEVLLAETETEDAAEYTESMAVKEPYEYLLKSRDGFLVVYEKDGKTLLFETNIRTANLEEELLEKLEPGIGFSNERELYDFLESYSS